jgi:hypothetical protein
MTTTFDTKNPENHQQVPDDFVDEITIDDIMERTSPDSKLCARVTIMKEFFVDELDRDQPEQNAMDHAMGEYISFIRQNADNLEIFEDGEFKFYIEYYEMELKEEFLPESFIYDPVYAQFMDFYGNELDE